MQNDPLKDFLEGCNTSHSVQLNLKQRLDLKKIEDNLSSEFVVLASTPVVLLVRNDKNAISIYQSGKIILKNDSNDKELAKKSARKLLKLMGWSDAKG